MFRLRFIITILFSVLFQTGLQAQPVRQYYFTHYTTESGLLSTEVNTVVQDADGYIWVGGVDGLQRFDGTRFRTFRHSPGDQTTLPSNHVRQLVIDSRNRLWVLTSEGAAGYFDTKTFRFTASRITIRQPEAAGAAVKRLILDEYGNVFILFGGLEVITWNEASNEFSWKYNFFETPPGTGVADFRQQPGTPYYWIAGGRGVGIYNRDTRVLSYPGKNRERLPAIEALAGISIPFHFLFDKKGYCWFQSWQKGLPLAYRINTRDTSPEPESYEFISLVKSYYETYEFFEQQDGSIWIGGLNLFARFIEDENRFQLVYNGYRNERSIVYERLTAIYEDREKNLWVGTDNNGLYRFNPSRQYFTNVAHTNRLTGNPGKGSLLSFAPTRWGTILAGSWGDGLYQYNKELNLVPLRIRGFTEQASPTVWGMYPSGDSNTIWLAAQPGIVELNQQTRTARTYNPPQLNNKTVRQVVEDKKGNLWLGLQNFGLFRWSSTDKSRRDESKIERFEPVPPVMVNKVTVDSKGWVWAATALRGLYVIDPALNKVVHLFSDSSAGAYRLPEAAIASVMEYDDSLMAIATSRYLLVYNRHSKKTVRIGRPGIMKGSIAALERDKKGYVWVATTNGLYRVNFQTRVFAGFNRSDGIDNDHFILAASTSLPDGRLLFGSSTEFIAFSPDSIQISGQAPVPRFTDFRVMNNSLQVDSLQRLKQVVLPYNRNSVEIEFSTLVYSSAFVILYKMEGIDKEWKFADRNNHAIYSYLPVGKHRFLMKTMDSEGTMSGTQTALSIRIVPPFWKSWWFFCALLLLAGIPFYWFDRERMKRKEAIQRMRSNIADNLHSDVNTALNNINILSEMARLKADKDPGKSIEYIEQIHTKSQNMIIAMDDMLWSLDPGNDSMEKTTDRMREYIDALRNRHGVNIDIAVDQKVETLPLNMKLRHDSFLVFKEGLKNLVTLGAENLHVYIKSDRSDLLFITLFESEHCDMQLLNNLLHRQDLEQRLQAMKASIEVDLHKNHSSISLRVPVL